MTDARLRDLEHRARHDPQAALAYAVEVDRHGLTLPVHIPHPNASQWAPDHLVFLEPGSRESPSGWYTVNRAGVWSVTSWPTAEAAMRWALGIMSIDNAGVATESPRRNPDDDLRRLERAAASGDRDAHIALDVERYRRGLPSVLGWLVEGHSAFDVTHTSDYIPAPGVLANRERGRQEEVIDDIGRSALGEQYWSFSSGLDGWEAGTRHGKTILDGPYSRHVGRRDNRLGDEWKMNMERLATALEAEGHEVYWVTRASAVRGAFVLLDADRIHLARDLHEHYASIIKAMRGGSRRNSDDDLRRLERRALTGDADAAMRFGVALLRAGDLDIERLCAAREAAGLPVLPEDASQRCWRVFLGVGSSVLVRMTWDEITHGLGLQDQLIYADDRGAHTPDWIDDQAWDDAEFWIDQFEERREVALTDDQRQAVQSQYYYAIELEWMPSKRITRDLIQRWIVDPINRSSEGGVDEWLARDDERRPDLCAGKAIEIEHVAIYKEGVFLEDTGVTFRVFEPIYTAMLDARHSSLPVTLDNITPEAVLAVANWLRQERVVLPHHDGDDYRGPSEEKLLAAIREAGPLRKKRKKR